MQLLPDEKAVTKWKSLTLTNRRVVKEKRIMFGLLGTEFRQIDLEFLSSFYIGRKPKLPLLFGGILLALVGEMIIRVPESSFITMSTLPVILRYVVWSMVGLGIFLMLVGGFGRSITEIYGVGNYKIYESGNGESFVYVASATRNRAS